MNSVIRVKIVSFDKLIDGYGRIGGVLAAIPLAVFLALTAARPALADLVLSQVVLDFQPGQPPREDIEVLNDGRERLYVVVEPAEIKSPGLPGEQRVQMHDPQELGLLASPARLILEPGQRKFVRIAAITAPGDQDRIYRVTIKPVVGELNSTASGVKVLVGYDVLVILRPQLPIAVVTAIRLGKRLVFQNMGNTNAELFHGRQCDASGKKCTDLPATRLYAGATWQVDLSWDTPVEYTKKVGGQITIEQYK